MCGHCEDPWSRPFLPGTILCQGFSICRFSPAPSASGSFSEGRLSTVRETSALRLRTALLDPMVSASPGVQAGQAGGVYEIKGGATECERPKSLQIDQRECNSAGQ